MHPLIRSVIFFSDENGNRRPHTPPERHEFNVVCTGKGKHKRAKITDLQFRYAEDGNPFIYTNTNNEPLNSHNWKPRHAYDQLPSYILLTSTPDRHGQDGTLEMPGWSHRSWHFVCGRCKRDFRRDESKMLTALESMKDGGIFEFDISYMEMMC